jgi:hypothetical protein
LSSNGHTNKATHFAPDALRNPATYRHPALRGVQIQRPFGSQRALKTIEDFTRSSRPGDI